VKIYYSQEEIDQMINHLIEQIDSKKFTTVVGIKNGGLHISHKIADVFGLPHETVRISHYDGEIFRDKPIVDDTFRLREGEKYLIVDDLVDGGSTMLTFKEYFGIRECDAVAVLFWCPEGDFKPDYYVNEKNDDWIIFPWEIK
jgi:hypoxanthine phosphoribosyltransferase